MDEKEGTVKEGDFLEKFIYRYYYTLLRRASSTTVKTANADAGVEPQELFAIIAVGSRVVLPPGNTEGLFLIKLDTCSPYAPVIALLGMFPKKSCPKLMSTQNPAHRCLQ